MKKAKSTTLGLRALSDMVLIQEDPMSVYSDDESGLTADVSKAIKDKKLFIPEAYENFSKKNSCRGTVVARGDEISKAITVGDRVIFARLGGMRFTMEGQEIVALREKDILALII